ncbi:Arginine metabolism regulation protein II [Pseudocercospora fuligena]|uniref:Arginine metabolism regulation protein II n=1 Tax=Pseudocercospora fuligena TaxID=685502 RepID=A0A8H6RTF6_9PEZI|nr:Arginine metabolism regulation protein II [Pseudocercospora fuligena]
MEQKSSKRSHSFTGCWTCRRRRVKCSLEKPTCTRCTNAGLECLGYGFLFDVPEGVQSSRQNLPADCRPDLKLKLTNGEIEEYLTDLESVHETTNLGPFSVISSTDDEQSADSGDTKQISGHDWKATRYRRSHDSIKARARGSSRNKSKSTTALQTASRHPRETFDVVIVPESLPAIHGLSSHEKELFEHYMQFLTPTLAPFAGPTYGKHRNLIPSVALESRMSSASDSDATAAVFHGVCAAACMSLAQANRGRESYRIRALGHSNLAFGHLRSSIENGTNSYFTVAIAVMTFLLVEHVADRAESFRAHLDAGLRCLMLAIKSKASLDDSTRAICEQWVIVCALGNISSPTHQQALLRAMGQGTGYLTHGNGIPLMLVELIVGINAFTAPESEAVQKPEPAILEAQLRDLRLRASNNGTLELQVATTAASLYFTRAIQGLPIYKASAEVDSGLAALELVKSDPNDCIVAWTACVIGSECYTSEQKSRFVAWCRPGTNEYRSNIQFVRRFTRTVWDVRASFPKYEDGIGYVAISSQSMSISSMIYPANYFLKLG